MKKCTVQNIPDRISKLERHINRTHKGKKVGLNDKKAIKRLAEFKK